MQLLCIAALLLSAVAAHPDAWRPKQDEKLSPTGGPKLDADSTEVTHTPEDGDGGSGRDWPEWDSQQGLHEMPTGLPHRPSGRPGNGISRGPVKGTDGNGHKPERPHHVPTRGKRQVPGFTPDKPGVRRPGHSGKPKGSPKGRWANRRNPGEMAFSPVFKVDNVTFQNLTDVTLKEGENLFLVPKHGERGPRHHEGGKHGPPRNGKYVKLIYNATVPNKVAIEYGVMKPMALAEMFGEEDDPEEYY